MSGSSINAFNGGGKQTINIGGLKISVKVGSIIIVGVLIVALLLGAKLLNSPNKQIIGTWQTDGGGVIVFNDNGTYSHSGGWYGSYSISGDVLTLSPVLNNPEVYTILISSKSLTLYYRNGEIYREFKKIS